MICFNPIHEVKAHGMANVVIDHDLDFLLGACRLIAVVNRCVVHSLGRCSIDLVGALPIAVGSHHMGWFAFVVGLHLIGQAVWNINFWKVDADEERTVVVGRVAGCAFHPTVSGNANVKGAVFRCVFCVLEPHCSLEVEGFSCCNPCVVRHVIHSKFTIIVPHLEPTEAETTVDFHCVIAE